MSALKLNKQIKMSNITLLTITNHRVFRMIYAKKVKLIFLQPIIMIIKMEIVVTGMMKIIVAKRVINLFVMKRKFK